MGAGGFVVSPCPPQALNRLAGVLWNMARMALATGSCPTCGRTVVRTVSLHHGLATEAYHCPVHGRRTAGDAAATVAEWAAAPSMATLREMYDVVAPRIAGLDWLA